MEKQLLATRGQMLAWLYVRMKSIASLVKILLTLLKFKKCMQYRWKWWQKQVQLGLISVGRFITKECIFQRYLYHGNMDHLVHGVV